MDVNATEGAAFGGMMIPGSSSGTEYSERVRRSTFGTRAFSVAGRCNLLPDHLQYSTVDSEQFTRDPICSPDSGHSKR